MSNDYYLQEASRDSYVHYSWVKKIRSDICQHSWKIELAKSYLRRNRIQYNPNFLFLSADWLEIYIKKIFHEYDRYISPNIIDIEVRAGFQFPENPSRYN